MDVAEGSIPPDGTYRADQSPGQLGIEKITVLGSHWRHLPSAGEREAVMAVLLTQDLPVTREDVEAVSAELGVKDNPPEGLILHTFTVTSEGVHVVDVWESSEHYDRFRDERLMPVMTRVMAERNRSLGGPPPEPQFVEAYDIVKGR
jgi:hypothetical protein